MDTKPKNMLMPYDLATELCKTLIKMPNACENNIVWEFCKYVFDKQTNMREREKYKKQMISQGSNIDDNDTLRE